MNQSLVEKCQQIRTEMLQMCINAGKGHVTSSMSCIEIMVALYHGGILKVDPKDPKWNKRDRFVLSKGQASPALYTILADLGFFSKDELKLFAKTNGIFAVHLQNSVPGVELTVGSLGQAYVIGAGLAMGLRSNGDLSMVYALLGDGECYEGSIWEAAMFISHNKLSNLITIIDRNHMCVTDFTENLVELEPFADKWKAFGFNVIEIDGHDVNKLVEVLEKLKTRPSRIPTVIIADTVKGKGIPSMCYDPMWHGTAPSGDAAILAMEELTTKG